MRLRTSHDREVDGVKGHFWALRIESQTKGRPAVSRLRSDTAKAKSNSMRLISLFRNSLGLVAHLERRKGNRAIHYLAIVTRRLDDRPTSPTIDWTHFLETF